MEIHRYSYEGEQREYLDNDIIKLQEMQEWKMRDKALIAFSLKRTIY